jgi:hypothetical protein
VKLPYGLEFRPYPSYSKSELDAQGRNTRFGIALSSCSSSSSQALGRELT